MSLFENDEYRWRETFFVLFDEDSRPPAATVEKTLQNLNPLYQIQNVQADEQGRFESLTLISSDDYAAMDISYVCEPEVMEQGAELAKELKDSATSKQDQDKLKQLLKFNARLDIFHFEQIVFVGGGDEDEEFLDPGLLLSVLEKLAKLCQGVSIDPQSGLLME